MDLKQSLTRLAKADFADSLGVALTEHEVAVAHVRKRFNAVTCQGFASRTIDVPAEGRWPLIVDFLREFGRRQGVEAPRVSVALARRDALIGHMQIPAAAIDNIDNVVRYELDRIIPVPSDALYTNQYWRALGTAGERVAVSIIAGMRERVDEVHRELSAAGLAPSAVTTTPVALNDYYYFARGEHAGTAGIFTPEGDRECLTISSDGLLVSSLHFDPARESRGDRLRRELETVLPERAVDDVALIIEAEQEQPEDGDVDLEAIAPEGLLTEAGTPAWPEVVAIGAALGQLGEARQKINLLPQGMARAEEGIGLREMALSAVVVIVAAALAGSIAFKNLSVGNALAAEVSRLMPRVTRVTQQEEQNRHAQETLELLERHRRVSVLAYLKAMTDSVPKTAYLTTFRYKGDRIEVDGIAAKASDLIGVLERSPLFKNVEFTAPTTKYLQSQERFSLRMELER